MASPLPPDPYLALGVAKDATAAAIKLQYRKLVLKFHPDKVQDEAQKQIAADQFHNIQTAWEIIGNEDKRKRYDAKVELAQLRKDVLVDRHGGAPPRSGADVRTTAYKMSTESARGGAFYAKGPERAYETSPTYEERKPAYAGAQSNGGDYFDYTPRPSARREPEHDRPKRSSPREDRERRAAKEAKEAKERESARQQKERSRRSDKDIRRDRATKAAYVEDEDDSSDPDEYERPPRRAREDPAELRRAQEAYHEQARKEKEAAQRGYYDSDERARKLYSQYDGAREYMEKSRGHRSRPESEPRRPSPARAPSSKVEYIKRAEGRPPVMVRRGSGRPTTGGRDDERRSSARETERRSGDEYDEAPRRPPILSSSKSSPADIRIPTDKPRAFSVQVDRPEKEDMPPKIKRADTMPAFPDAPPSRERDTRRKDNAPLKGSGLRQTEFMDGLPTPGTTPEHSGANSSPPKQYRYQQEYADDNEYPTPDGYRTELRQPPPPTTTSSSKPRYTRSPERMPDRGRSSSARYLHTSPQRAPPLPRTTSTQYVYTHGQGVTAQETQPATYSRPAVSRENSGATASARGGGLYGEIPTTRDARETETRSPRQSGSRYSPPVDGVRYGKEIRPEDIRMQSGYGTTARRGEEGSGRPGYSRGGASYIHAK